MSSILKTTAAAWSPDDVTIPNALFNATLSLLDEFDIQDYDSDIIQLYGYVIHSLNTIKATLDFKDAFTRFFYTDDGNACFSAHMNSEILTKSADSWEDSKLHSDVHVSF